MKYFTQYWQKYPNCLRKILICRLFEKSSTHVYYRQPTKLWESKVFSHVCLSGCSQGDDVHVTTTRDAIGQLQVTGHMGPRSRHV